MTAFFSQTNEQEILLHIGPHKTGTTGLQQAALRAQTALEQQGRIYLHDEGREQLNTSAIKFLRTSGDRHFLGSENSLAHTSLYRILKSAKRGKLILSSEHFCRYQDVQIHDLRMLLEEIYPGVNIKVLITLRPLAKIIPGEWQQFVRAQIMPSLDEWVQLVLREQPTEAHGRTFRQRHSHDQLVLRWAAEFGKENLSVIIADDKNPEFLFRAFEQLIGVWEGTLVMRRLANESLTLQEAEAVRAAHDAMHRVGMFGNRETPEFNSSTLEPTKLLHHDDRAQVGWSYDRIVQSLVSSRAYREGEKVVLRGEAQRKVAAWSHAIVEGIKASGVHVIGNIEDLISKPQADEPDAPRPEAIMITPRLAGELVTSALQAVGVGGAQVDARVLRKISTSKLVRLLVKRALPHWIRARVADRPR